MRALVLDRVAERILLYVVDCVRDDTANVRVKEGLAGLVTGLKVEDLIRAARPDRARTEDVSVLKPTAEDELLGLGNKEGLAIKLLAFDALYP